MKAWRVLLAGAICGALWWGLSVLMGAEAGGLLGTRRWIGITAGMVTGVLILLLSAPVYRRASSRMLLWFSPLSVYVAIAIYGLMVFLLRAAVDDFTPSSIRWATGVQSVLAMWWGVTLFLPFAVAVHLSAYVNHRVLRRLTLAGGSG